MPLHQRRTATLQLPSAAHLDFGLQKPGNLGASPQRRRCRRGWIPRSTASSISTIPMPFGPPKPTFFTKHYPMRFCTTERMATQSSDPVDATTHKPSKLTEVDYQPASALLMGSESQGLSETWPQKAQQHIAIPMLGKADSLNVAAAAICLYEARRQRQAPNYVQPVDRKAASSAKPRWRKSSTVRARAVSISTRGRKPSCCLAALISNNVTWPPTATKRVIGGSSATQKFHSSYRRACVSKGCA